MLGGRRTGTATPKLRSGSSSERRGPDVLFSSMHGRASGAEAERLHQDLMALLRSAPARYWIVDTTALDSFDAATLPGAATALLRDLKARNLTVIVVVTSAPIRMMGSTLCFAAGIQHRFVDTLAEAERWMATLDARGD